MNKFILVLSLILSIGGAGSRNMAKIVTVEDDVFIGNQLPYWGEICTATKVYGDPYGLSEVGYSVSIGDVVSLHELSKPTGDWVSIAAAHWIPLSAVCPWGE